MRSFLQYVNEKIAENPASITGFYNYDLEKRKKDFDVIDVIWIRESKLEEIASYLEKTHNIKSKVEGDNIRVSLPSKYGRNKDFLLVPDNVLVLYESSYKILDKNFRKDCNFLHQLSQSSKKKFKYF